MLGRLKCNIKNCGKEQLAKGLCSTHYTERIIRLAQEMKCCSVEGCGKVHLAKGLCSMHYRRMYITGTTGLLPKKPSAPKTIKYCSVEGCGKILNSNGMCKTHYERMRLYGFTDKPSDKPKIKAAKSCSIEGCTNAYLAKGLCRIHYERLRHRGTTELVREVPELRADLIKRLSDIKKENPTNYWLGKERGPQSDEWKDKIAEGNKGKIITDEHKASIVKKLTGTTRPPKVIEKMREWMLKNAKRGPANNKWGKPPMHGKRIEYNGTVFRSSYEVWFVKILDAKNIKWVYEPERFDLGTCTYLPDFYLPETGAFWEVKGWLGPDSERKIKLFREVYPEVPLIVATKEVIKQFELTIK